MADYDIIEIGRNERRVIRVDSGETFENKLIDMTAEGAAALVYAHGTNWTIRNVGFKGAISGDNRALTCSDQGGNTSTVENVYMGDGVHKDTVGDQYAPALGIWVNPDHNGHLDFKNVYVEGALDNAFYCSAPGYNGRGGTVHIDGCYSKNNAISCYRIGARGDKVTNSVAVGGPNTHRGIWGWDPGPHSIENVDIALNGTGHSAVVAGANGKSTVMNLKNVQYDAATGLNERYGSSINTDSDCGTSPQDYVPDGCPTTPEEAASGSASGGSGKPIDTGPSFEHTMRFEGTGAYFFRTKGGDVEATDGADRIEGELDGETVEIGYNSYLDNIGVADGVDATIVVRGNEYTPTWSMYDGPDAEDWLEADYSGDEDDSDGDEGDGGDGEHGPECEDLLEQISELEDELTMAEERNSELKADLNAHREFVDEIETGLEQTESFKDRLQKQIALLRD